MRATLWVLAIVGIVADSITGVSRFFTATSFSGYLDGCAWVLLGLFVFTTCMTMTRELEE